ncbi:MAG: DOPA 4,5-dioxygenase family protein [Immundisolibacteraceae bacterium]|nr:DOPA 4,5-dioxygenase family protein [Immundisolibacteraceae bacterium]
MVTESNSQLVDVDQISGYHAHIYFEDHTRSVAEQIREQLAEFDVVLGRWKDGPVGPHTRAMYQVAFAPEQFDRVVRWLMVNRGGLDILVHPETGLGHAGDHTSRALWLGQTLPVKVEYLQQIDRDYKMPEAVPL